PHSANSDVEELTAVASTSSANYDEPHLPPDFPSSPPPPPPSPPQITAAGRPQRHYRLPQRYRDLLPEPPVPVEPEPKSPPSRLQRIVLFVRNRYQTAANSFGLWREYLYRPSYDPDTFISPEDLYQNQHANIIDTPLPPIESPHANESSAMLHEWQNTGSSNKSDREMNRLVHDILLHPQFSLDDLQNFNAQRENRHADESDKTSPLFDMFTEVSVGIDVPSGDKNIPSRIFTVPGLLYRRLTAVITAAFSDGLAAKFHFSPYKLFHTSPTTGEQERIFCETYDSDAFIEEHNYVQRFGEVPPDDPDCKREKVVAALLFWSDSTHLANFGTAKLWPIYLLFGNLSKYIRAQPGSGAVHHVAYIPSLPDFVQDKISQFHQKWGTQQKEILTH
ncbi:hypothetical protein H0H92_012592, partial [Tricholoma furcatifolium]